MVHDLEIQPSQQANATQPGWTLARLGARFGVDPTMVRREHRAADMTMQPRDHQAENSRDIGESAQLFIRGKRDRDTWRLFQAQVAARLYAKEVAWASHCTMAAMNKIMVMRPETVARTAPGLDHSPLFSCCHRRLTKIILNFCHLCSRRWQPISNPQELFRQNSPFLVTAPHQTGARNSAHTRPKPDKANRIVPGTALVGRAASRATTRANPHHLARLFFLLLDTEHLRRADAPRCRQSKPTFLRLVKVTDR
jgi:hypothetical protein